VLVRVRAAALNPADWHFMRGLPYIARVIFGLRKPRPAVLASDMAGQVEAVGKNVTRLAQVMRYSGGTANVPTPPDAPLIKTFWPAWTWPASRKACRAVSAAKGTAAACSSVRLAGFSASKSSGTHAYSAQPPVSTAAGRSGRWAVRVQGPPHGDDGTFRPAADRHPRRGPAAM
jgi:Alcohol dehydrogenase GroES-like domain